MAMDETYNWGYYRSHCGENYENQDIWTEFFKNVAQNIVDDLNPKTVLDIGCATGYLVAALRDLGVEAYGMDISAAAIAKGREDIRPYLQVYSLLGDEKPVGLPEHIDLVTNIEVLEHLYEEDIDKALANLCSFSDRILFSSSPDDIVEETHVNVRQPEYWVKSFSKQGFYRSFSYFPTYISPNTIYFSRREMTDLRLIEDYEHAMRLQKIVIDAQQRKDRTLPKEYHSELAFFAGGNCASKPLSMRSTQQELHWECVLPMGIKRIQFIPMLGRACIVQNPTMRIAGYNLQLLDIDGYVLPYTTAHPQPGQPIFANVTVPDGLPQPLTLLLDAKVVMLDDTMLSAIDHLGTVYRRRPKTIEADKYTKEIEGLQTDLEDEKNRYAQLEGHHRQLSQSYQDYKMMYESIAGSTFWRITKPAQFIVGGTKRGVRKACLSLPGLRTLYPYLSSVRHMGRAQVRFNQKLFGTLDRPNNPYIPSFEEYTQQKETKFDRPLVFSIVVPLYNTPERFLRDMIHSVQCQSYVQWELCLADGSDENHPEVEKIVAKYARKDNRIRYQKLETNEGISGNTNAALAMVSGDYIALLDHDDILNVNALYEMRKALASSGAEFLYSDEVTFNEFDLADMTVKHFKPDFAIDNLRANNYICHLSVFKKTLLEKAGGGFRSAYDGSQDFDLVLRLSEQANMVKHVPMVLYFWRSHGASVALGIGAKPYVVTAAKNAIASHLERVGLEGAVEVAPGLESMYRIRYAIQGTPKVSIIIPTKDEVDVLDKCLQSILEKTTYSNYEIILCENNSEEPATFAYYKELERESRIKQITYTDAFNYSAINNFAVEQASGDYIILLNNDTEIITPEWIEEMLMYAQRTDVGMVGAKLYYPDDTIQHGGLVIGMGGLAAHAQRCLPRNSPGYMGNLKYARNVGGVTGACMMMRVATFKEVGGLNERLKVAFNDVDLCLRVREAGYLIVYTPFAELYHYESKTRGFDRDKEGRARFLGEVELFFSIWQAEVDKGDPYFNPNLSLDTSDYTPK